VIAYDSLDTHKAFKKLKTELEDARLGIQALQDYAESENYNTHLICDQILAVANMYKNVLIEKKYYYRYP